MSLQLIEDLSLRHDAMMIRMVDYVRMYKLLNSKPLPTVFDDSITDDMLQSGSLPIERLRDMNTYQGELIQSFDDFIQSVQSAEAIIQDRLDYGLENLRRIHEELVAKKGENMETEDWVFGQ
ncbi:hypothetical protein N7478_011036 [Penicillium angulare]|uniref:uncharacterized protein n=1 Tax=Penicillium angulare TaxID=116970 RepID=UPI002541F50E|nr:uncharacterized protein N7478_011036 [Penicillium angulare]KAJ5263431.1 hypothetical protein N7478_011036 [Penicillium angulare]